MECLERIYIKYQGAFERALLVFWLLKDLGWMATIIFQGFLFGVLSVLLHFFLLVIDRRISMRFHHSALLLWVIANFLWMLVEFTCSIPSSHVHIGPDTPIGGITDRGQMILVEVKHWLFMSAVIIEISFYICWARGIIVIPKNEDELLTLYAKNTNGNKSNGTLSEDSQTEPDSGSTPRPSKGLFPFKSKNAAQGYVKLDNSIENDRESEYVEIELQTLGGLEGLGAGDAGNKEDMSEYSGSFIIKSDHSQSSVVNIYLEGHTNENERFHIPMLVIDHCYVIFWMFKDLFWSWSTGDFGIPMMAEFTCETLAIFFAVLTFICFIYITYLYRNCPDLFFDSLTAVCWINANLVWMSGEFFIRYDNMELDDHTENNDTSTRLGSLALFTCGLCLQFALFIRYIVSKYRLCDEEETNDGEKNNKSDENPVESHSPIQNVVEKV